MTKDEAKYVSDMIDKRVSEAVAALTPTQQQQAKAVNFANSHMQLLNGQEMLPQATFREFLRFVDFSNVQEAIDAAEAATAAVAILREKVRETEEGLAAAGTAIENLLVALTALRNKITEVEQAIPVISPYSEDAVAEAIDNHATNWYVYLTDLDVREIMIRDSSLDYELDGHMVYVWVTSESALEVFTYSEYPEENDRVYSNTSHLECGIVVDAPIIK